MKVMKKIVTLLMVVTLLLSIFLPLMNSVYADETVGTLTIKKTDRNKKPIQNVEFTIYMVEYDADPEDLTIPEWYTSNPGKTSDDTHYTAKLKTGADGQVVFNNLPLGRYLVLETDAPETVIKSKGFMVDVPMTQPDGKTLNYNVVAEPKNDIVAGTLVIEKQDKKTSKVLQGVTFKIQKLNEGSKIYEDWRGPYNTDASGQIRIENIPVGTYKIVEVKTLDGYVYDKVTELKFKVYLNEQYGTSMKFIDDGGNTTTDVPDKVVIKNEKPDFAKDVNEIQPTKVQFKITVDVPTVVKQLTKFKIVDTMQDGLQYVANSLTFDGNLGLVKDTDYTLNVTSGNKVVEIDFTAAGRKKLHDNLYNASADTVKSITLKYYADVLPGSTSTQYKNNAKLEYDSYTLTDQETINVGGFKLRKVDSREEPKKTLEGAKFKIAKTKQDAKNENFIKGANGEDILLTSAAGTGMASYYGLTYGTYYLVEVESPLDENGVRYNKLREPVEFSINATSYDDTKILEIKNSKGLTLPFSGGIGALIFIVAGTTIIGIALVMRKKEKIESK